MSIQDKFDAGNKNPPRNGQFKPGTSGNPSGRPKVPRTLRAELAQILKQRIGILESGTRKRITRQQAMLLTLLEKALRGDVRAASMIMTNVLKLESNAPEQPIPNGAPSETDSEIVADFLRRNQPTNS